MFRCLRGELAAAGCERHSHGRERRRHVIRSGPRHVPTERSRSRSSTRSTRAITRHSLTPQAGLPTDIAYAVAFLASDEAGFITGITIPIDGGLTAHFPTYAEELAATTPLSQ